MAQLGELLIASGHLTQEGLEEALDWQVLYGGRLGTNLLELKLVEEEHLALALGKQKGCEVAWGDIQLEASLLNVIPKHFADRQELVPWKLEKRRIKVLCTEIKLGVFDELGYKLGRPCTPVIAPEYRVFNLLRAHFGAMRQMRALDFGVVPEEGRAERKKKKEKVESGGVEAAPELIDESAFNDIYAQVLAGRTQSAPQQEAPTLAAPPSAPARPQPPPTVVDLPAMPAQSWHDPRRPLPAPAPVLTPSRGSPMITPSRGVPPVQRAPLPPTPHFGQQLSAPPPPPPSARAAPPAASAHSLPPPRTEPVLAVPPPPTGGVRSRTAVRVTNLSGPPPVEVLEALPDDAILELEPLEPEPEAEAEAEIAEPEAEAEIAEAEIVETELPLAPVVWEEQADAAPTRDESPLDFKEALRALEGVTDRDSIAHIVLRASRSKAARALLLQVQGGVALGWDGLGEGLGNGAARGVAIPLSAPSAFQLVVKTRSHFMGPLQKTPLNIRFLAACGKKIPLSSLILPILHRERVSHLLYLDNGHKQQAPTDVGEMLILSQRIAQTVEALVARKRRALRG